MTTKKNPNFINKMILVIEGTWYQLLYANRLSDLSLHIKGSKVKKNPFLKWRVVFQIFTLIKREKGQSLKC